MRVRRANREDLEFIKELTLETVDQGISTYRDIPNAQVRSRAADSLAELERMFTRKRDYAFLVAEDKGDLIGFLILEYRDLEETTGELQTLIYNMAVSQTYLGKRVDRLLVSEAARLSYQRGYRYMTARVTASNERALLAALRQGFEIERYQLTMACGAQGPEALPGRSKEERAHDLTRLRRHRQMRKEE